MDMIIQLVIKEEEINSKEKMNKVKQQCPSDVENDI